MEPRDRHFVIETYLHGLIEISSFCDFFSDIYILKQLSESVDTSWFTFMLFTMLCPYYTVYTSLISYRLNKIRQIRKKTRFGILSRGQSVKAFIAALPRILPTFLAYLILLDTVYMFLCTFCYCLLMIGMIFPCRKFMHYCFENSRHKTFEYLFGMSLMDINGFKCQRTILQLHLESIPQIFF